MMSELDDGTRVTAFGNDTGNRRLVDLGYSVRHIETWFAGDPEREESVIVWDAPELDLSDLPF